MVPDQGPVGTPVTIVGTSFGVQNDDSAVLFSGVEANIVLWRNALITTVVPEGAVTGPVRVVTSGGVSKGFHFTVTETPVPAQTWYLAEGTTAWGFETFVLIENTTNADATVDIVYNTTQYGRLPRPQPLNVPPNSRVTLNLNDDIGLELDVSTELQSSQEIVCERAMYWSDRLEGTDSIGVNRPSRTWYLAEGCTTFPFETWLLIQNPSASSDARVDITYMTPGGPVPKETISLAAGSRTTVDVSRDVGSTDVSTKVSSSQDVICERSMYWDSRRGGHASIGVAAPSTDWYLAEGSTAWGFQTWLLLQNPGGKQATAEITYMTPEGPVTPPEVTLPPNSRKSLLVNESIPRSDTSIAVKATGAIIAERAMYWDNGTGRAGHETVGMTAPATEIYLAEGSTAWGFETYLCLQNPNDKPVEVGVTYLTDTGPVPGKTLEVPRNSRVTVKVSDELPARDASIKVTCKDGVMAERSMYWNAKGAGHASIGWVPR
jgi:hypothetical protein